MANSVVLRNGHILSCKSGGLAEYHWLHVEEGRIKGIGCGEAPDTPGVTIDLEGRTVLPGLADSHSLQRNLFCSKNSKRFLMVSPVSSQVM